MCNPIYKSVDISAIDFEDRRYSISSAATDQTALAASITAKGILCPLWLRQLAPDCYIIIDGFKRAGIGRQIGLESLPALVYLFDGNADTDNATCLEMAIAQAAFVRGLSDKERVQAVVRLSRYLSLEKIVEIAQWIFNLKLNLNIIQDYMLMTNLPDAALDLLDGNRLSVKTCIRLAHMDTSVINVLLPVFEQIRLSASNQLNLMEMVIEVVRKEGISPNRLLASPEVVQILQSEKWDEKAKGDKLLDYLKKKRYPELARARARFDDQIRQLGLPQGMSLVPPPFFEGRQYRLTCEFTCVAEFKEQTRFLHEVTGDDVLMQMLP